MIYKDMAENRKNNDFATMVYIPFVGWMVAIVVLVIEKDQQLRFQAVQSLLTYGVYLGIGLSARMLQMTVVLLPLAWLIRVLLGVTFLGGWLAIAVRTHRGENVRLPYLAELAEKIVK